MGTAIFRGDAVAVAQVTRVTPGTVVAGDTYALKINGKILRVTAESASQSELCELLVDAISSSLIPEFREVVADVDGNSLTLTSITEGLPFVVSSMSGDFEVDEYQVVTINHGANGNFTLKYQFRDELEELQEEETANIATTASTGTVQTALENLPHVGVGNVLVTGEPGRWIIHFTGVLARTDVLTLVADRSGLTGGDCVLVASKIQHAQAGTDNVQTVTFYGGGSGGTRTFRFKGHAFTVAYNANAATTQAAARLIPSINGPNVTVSGTANVSMVFTFIGELGHAVQPLLECDCSGVTGGTIYAEATVTTEGQPTTNQISYVFYDVYADGQAYIRITRTSSGSWSGGSWVLAINGDNSAAIPYDATESEIATIVQDLLDSHGILCVAASGSYQFYFHGPLKAFGLTSVSVVSSITGGSVSVSTWTSGDENNSPTPADQQYTLSMDGNITAHIPREATVAEIQSAVDTAIGAGNAVVTGLEEDGNLYSKAGLYEIEFTGSYGGRYVYLTITNYSTGVFDTQGRIDSFTFQEHLTDGANEVVTLTVHGAPSRGSFLATFGGSTTDPLLFSDSAEIVEAKFLSLPNISDSGLAASGGPFPGSPVVLTMGGEYSFTDIGPISINDNDLKVEVVQTTPGVAGVNEKVRLSIRGQDVWGGEATLTVDSIELDPLPWDLTYSELQAEIDGELGSNKAIATGGPWPENDLFLEYVGTNAETVMDPITGDMTDINNGTITVDTFDPMIVSDEVPATGPNHWNDPTNWSTGLVPEWGDTVELSEGETDILYGLRQVSTFTVDTVNDQILPAGCDLIVGQKVRVWTTSALPGGLSDSTNYYITHIDSVTGKLKLSATFGGSTVNLTSSGSGTHYIGVRLTAPNPLPAMLQMARFTGMLGLPRRNENGYWEYRPRYLVIGLDPAGSMVVVLNQGEGSGSSLIRIDTLIDQVSFETLGSASSAEQGAPAINLLGVNSANVVNVLDGDVGIAFYAGEVSTINKLNQRNGTVQLGKVTFAGTNPWIDKTGGEISTRDQATMSGVLKLRG